MNEVSQPAGAASPPESAGSKPSPAAHRAVGWTMALGLLGLCGLIAFADVEAIAGILLKADPWWLALTFLGAAITYVAMALSYHGIALAAGVFVPFAEMLRITLVANTANYMVASGGLSGFAVRMYFLTRRAVPSGTAVVISLAQTFLTNVTLLFFITAGFAFLAQHQALAGFSFAAVVLILFLCAGATTMAAVLLLHTGLRRRTLFLVGHTLHWVMYRLIPHRTPPRIHVWRYQKRLDRSIDLLLSRPKAMIAPLVYILLDWVFTIFILHAAFLAVHHPVPISVVIIGFAVGMVLSVVSLVPGGLGVMEGSMAAIFAGFGIPLEAAVAGALLFRISYYLLPVAVSLFFFHGMVAQGRAAQEAVEEEDF